MNNNRPKGMSQLDYLWTNYGKASLSNIVSEVPSDEIILTESAIISYIQEHIPDIGFDAIEEGNQICIRIKNQAGTVVDEVCFDKGSRITKFEKFSATQEDVDKGISQRVGNLCLTLQDSIGQKFFIELPRLQGQETDSIITVVKDDKVSGQLKINNPIVDRSVDIKSTPDGIRADLVIDEENAGSVLITKGNNGVSCHYKWQDENTEVRLKALTSSEYYLLQSVDNGTLYFITDLPCIYFRNKRYATANGDVSKELFDQTIQELNQKIDSNKQSIETLQNTVSEIEGADKNRIEQIVNNQITNYDNNLWWEETL